MTGKEKCELLRQIRKEIAEKNGIEYNPRECTHKGDCQGTCAMCDMEVRYLDAQINKKAEMGGRIKVAGVSLDKVKVETTGGNMNRNKSWWKHRDSGEGRDDEFEGYVSPGRGDVLKSPRGSYNPGVTQTMGIVIPPDNINTSDFGKKNSMFDFGEDKDSEGNNEDV